MWSSREWMRSSREWMRSSRGWVRSSRGWMRFSRVVRASDCQRQSRNSPGLDPSILRHSGIRGAADDAVLKKIHLKNSKSPLFVYSWFCQLFFLNLFYTASDDVPKIPLERRKLGEEPRTATVQNLYSQPGHVSYRYLSPTSHISHLAHSRSKFPKRMEEKYRYFFHCTCSSHLEGRLVYVKTRLDYGVPILPLYPCCHTYTDTTTQHIAHRKL